MIETIINGDTLEICINRPEKKNALSHEMYLCLADILDNHRSNEKCKSIIIYGANSIFTAGADLNDFHKKRGPGDSPGVTFLRAISKVEIPIIAAVEGLAIGIGATMLQHCDFVYTTADTKFRMPFVALGLCAEGASTYLLEKIVGKNTARDWLLTARFFNGQEALNAGFVTNIVSNDKTLETARATAKIINELPTNSIFITKKMLNSNYSKDIQKAFDNEVAMFAKLLSSKETQLQINSTGKTNKQQSH